MMSFSQQNQVVTDAFWVFGVCSHCPELNRDDEECDVHYPPESPSPTSEDEEYLTINSVFEDELPCADCLEADSGTIPLPQFCSWGPLPESLLLEGSHESDSEWEDLEEPVDTDDGGL
ncbi:Hypothetical predicted protein, partial [Marmota monax]